MRWVGSRQAGGGSRRAHVYRNGAPDVLTRYPVEEKREKELVRVSLFQALNGRREGAVRCHVARYRSRRSHQLLVYGSVPRAAVLCVVPASIGMRACHENLSSRVLCACARAVQQYFVRTFHMLSAPRRPVAVSLAAAACQACNTTKYHPNAAR